MKNLKLFIALVAISLGISSCTSTSDTDLTAALTSAYFVRTQTLVNEVYSYKYYPFFGLSANKDLVKATCTVNDEVYKLKKITSYYFFSDYLLNTPFESIKDMTIKFVIEDEKQKTLTVLNTITDITDDMGPVSLTKLVYDNGIVYLTYDETENAKEYVLTVRSHGDSFRRSFLLSADHTYTLSNLNIEVGTQLDVCLSVINAAKSVVADSSPYTIRVGTDFSTED